MMQVKPMSPGLVLPVGAPSPEPFEACSSSSSTTATTPSMSDAEQQHMQKQKELQQALAKQKRQLYEKKFEKQHLNRPRRQRRALRKQDQSHSTSVQGLTALQQHGQALLVALAHCKESDKDEPEDHEDVFGVPKSQHLDQELPAFMPGFCTFRGQHLPQAEATARDGDTVPIVLSNSSEQLAHLLLQPDLSSKMEYFPALLPGLSSTSLPTLLSRGPHTEKKPFMTVRPPPGLEVPQSVPKTLDWLSQGVSDMRTIHGIAAEPQKIQVGDLASFLCRWSV
eukprot:TRINITY_DN9721_c0_g1_i1.p1 TRINITY_DN9721_c0_g1~~TRINITY_DN9721_c0_g1_i1.p1  ORF type:complete len:281 (+),score=56.83 TRINITY_DN9721_c0_g1_i1:62-904(+)